MKITKTQLKQIIKEELRGVLNEIKFEPRTLDEVGVAVDELINRYYDAGYVDIKATLENLKVYLDAGLKFLGDGATIDGVINLLIDKKHSDALGGFKASFLNKPEHWQILGLEA